jgi:hypothetical protein
MYIIYPLWRLQRLKQEVATRYLNGIALLTVCMELGPTKMVTL